ncbi:MAG: molybdopterin dinucleotide binding domain-containing protein [bacterium]
MSERLTLITGRTRDQAIGLHRGKSSPEYVRATTFVEMNPEDMARLKVEDGGSVRLRTAAGEVELSVRAGALPPGLLFIPMGAPANRLVAVDTQGTGMPSFKELIVEVMPAESKEGAS